MYLEDTNDDDMQKEMEGDASGSRGLVISTCDNLRTLATRVLYSPVCWPLQIFMFVCCLVMLIWDILRHHALGQWVQSFDYLYIMLDYLLCILLLLEVIVRALATGSRFFTEFFNYIDMIVLALLFAVNIVMHTRLDTILGRRQKSRDVWVLSVYGVRYVAQLARMALIWNEQNAISWRHEAAGECINIPCAEDTYESSVKFRSENGYSDYNTFGASSADEVRFGRERSSTLPYDFAPGSSEEMKPIASSSRDGRRMVSSYERRKFAAETLAVAFDVTPLDSPAGESWALSPSLTPRQTNVYELK
mmetsp:Transcript_17781/g.24851  ORF Transcript_17781/g.24851 Transcript_17781/m.24851 type:complete len:305 (+) Transcript_17781:313-1227(+)|eukprot:CAMPEP_0184479224 /NCGR_PEP_ID=MMETSP0113_2-20130426/1033_1 /TAXON_ID=91329 /ORGANISM="Norrisiella sphaerica, Strain BC52" /LENGTH=304 /DNA_ID=CAMNT_0026857261 /DNA_START=316 /DNA_END=1230 /DNA_ORIENTATION=+